MDPHRRKPQQLQPNPDLSCCVPGVNVPKRQDNVPHCSPGRTGPGFCTSIGILSCKASWAALADVWHCICLIWLVGKTAHGIIHTEFEGFGSSHCGHVQPGVHGKKLFQGVAPFLRGPKERKWAYSADSADFPNVLVDSSSASQHVQGFDKSDAIRTLPAGT